MRGGDIGDRLPLLEPVPERTTDEKISRKYCELLGVASLADVLDETADEAVTSLFCDADRVDLDAGEADAPFVDIILLKFLFIDLFIRKKI